MDQAGAFAADMDVKIYFVRDRNSLRERGEEAVAMKDALRVADNTVAASGASDSLRHFLERIYAVWAVREREGGRA